MVDVEGFPSNQLFDTLSDWNEQLKDVDPQLIQSLEVPRP